MPGGGHAASLILNPVKWQQIIAAARHLFFANGFSATSMEAVAKSAGVGKATLYEMFPSKVELLRALIMIELDMRTDHLVLASVGPGQLRERLSHFAHGLMDLLLSPANTGIYRVIIEEVPRHPELGRLFYENGPARLIQRLADYLAALMEQGWLLYGQPRLVAAQFIGIVRADMHTRTMFAVDESIWPESRAAVVEHGVDVFLRAYGKPQTPS